MTVCHIPYVLHSRGTVVVPLGQYSVSDGQLLYQDVCLIIGYPAMNPVAVATETTQCSRTHIDIGWTLGLSSSLLPTRNALHYLLHSARLSVHR